MKEGIRMTNMLRTSSSSPESGRTLQQLPVTSLSRHADHQLTTHVCHTEWKIPGISPLD